ncbi:alpha/beta hydrolase family protein [Actinomadura physcomitrii]|uniref:hypothetical protein n=1 Tax=Actinomadura physcomitrii TaxID=2650748 RepID=UPI00136B5860|nr:hypothetical protein [Actinomadura physcomitrii]
MGLLIALLGNASSTALRHRIASAAGEAAGFAGWIWHDLGDPHKSALYYRTARDLLPEAGNPALASYISGYQALANEAEGHADDAVHHARQALDTAPKATTRLTLSWLSALTAGTLAATGRRDDSLALLHQAEEHFDAARDREEWMYEFDRTALADYRGQCHLRLGHVKEAITAFSEDWPRSRPPANGAAPRSPSASPKPTSATAGSTRPPTPHTARWRSSPPITPPAQSRALAAALGPQARLLAFPGEGHVLRSPESIKQALTAEENFLADLPTQHPE